MIKYFEILFRHKLRFAAVFLLLPAIASGAVAYLMPQYSAATTVWVDDPSIFGLPASTTGWNQYNTPADNGLDGFTQLASTHAFVDGVGKKLDAAKIWTGRDERTSVLVTLPTDLVAKTSGSHLIVLTYICHRAALCPAVLKAAIAVWQNWESSNLTGQTNILIQVYTSQISQAKAALAAADNQLVAYASTHPGLTGTTGVDHQYDSLSATTTTANAQLNDVQAKLSSLNLTLPALTQIDQTMLRIIDQPVWPAGGHLSSLPKKQLLAVWGGGAGVGLVLILITGWLDRTARDPQELERRLGIPVLASIPPLGLLDTKPV